MRKFFILAGLTIAGLFGGFQLQLTWQAGQNREELAQSWSSDSVQFAAIGPNNRTLFVALSDMGQAEDDAFLGSVVQDHHLASELRDLGFEHIQCGTRSMAVAVEVKTSGRKNEKSNCSIHGRKRDSSHARILLADSVHGKSAEGTT